MVNLGRIAKALIIALLSAIIGFINLRLIKITFNSNSIANDYFKLLILYAFVSSIASSILTYYFKENEEILNWLKKTISKNLALLSIISSILLSLVVRFDISILVIIYLIIQVILFEIVASVLILKDQYYIQQLTRIIPHLLVITHLFFWASYSPSLVHTFLFGILLTTIVTILIAKLKSPNKKVELKVINKSSYSTYILIIILSGATKYIPVLESNYLGAINLLPLFIYSSKGFNFFKGLSEQIFGLNLFSYFENLSEKKLEISILYGFLIASGITLLAYSIVSETLLNLIGFKLNDPDYQLVFQLSNSLILLLPIIALAISLKNRLILSNGIKPLQYLLLFEFVFGMLLYVFFFKKFTIWTPILYNYGIWIISSYFILIKLTKIRSAYKIVLIFASTIYIIYAATFSISHLGNI